MRSSRGAALRTAGSTRLDVLMPSAYEASYHRIAAVDELQLGRPKLFRAAGATILVRLNEQGVVTAIDAASLAHAGDRSPDARIREVLGFGGSDAGSGSAEWQELELRAGLPARLEDGHVWVCIDACKPGETRRT